jgi:hypothetical protein
LERIVLEISSPHRLRKMYKIVEKDSIIVGRGYRCDVILSDPYVSAEHVRIFKEESGWKVEDLGSKNGLYLKKEKKIVKEIFIESGQEISIGKTVIKILSPGHVVVPTKRLIQKSKFYRILGNPVFIGLSLLAVICVFILEAYLTSSKPMTVGRLVSSSVGIALGIVVWGGLWAFVGRLIKKETRFFLHISVSALFFLFMLPINNLATYVGFMTSSTLFEGVIFIIFFWIVFTSLLVRTLALATNITSRMRVVISNAITVVLIVTAVLFVFTYKDDFSAYPGYYSVLKYPAVKILPSKSIDQFFEQSSVIFDIDISK